MSEFINVKDRLPELPIDKKGYVCRCIIGENDDYPFYMILHYYALEENPHFQHECDLGIHVTHWAPIPKLPEER